MTRHKRSTRIRRAAARRDFAPLGFERCEPRHLMATDTGHMAVGMNLENVVDWSPAWTFTDAFKASRPWISQAFNTQTWGTNWDPAAAPLLDVDADGNVRSLKTWTENGVTMRQFAGTLMFRGLAGDYAGGTYRAEWDGTGVVTFGFDAVVTASGRTAAGRNFADLRVTPTDNGIFMRIEETSPTDPVRNFNVWMPDWNGHRFVGERWQPGAAYSPFHPLFLERLAPFKTLRFMGMQETNTSDIVTWSQRRDAADVRQGSGPEGTPSEPIANGISLEYMVELANELHADPWFNMPYQADDTFVRNFATYVRDHLEAGRKVYVEWANEVWNFGWGFEASQWVADQARAQNLDPDYGQWIVTGHEAKRDFDIWSNVFAGQTGRLVRVAAGQAANSWIVDQICSNMGGSFDAIALAPYLTPTDAQRASYTGATTVDRVLADTRTNLATSLQWTTDHATLARSWSTKLGRPVQLVAYEGGPHLDGRGAAYQQAFYDATNDPRMGDLYRDYLKGLDTAGLNLYVDFQFTGPAGATPWGDFAKLHRMDQPLTSAYRYNAVAAAADGSLWGGTTPPSPAIVTVSTPDATAAEAGLDPGTIRFTRSGGVLSSPLTVTYTITGTATATADYQALAGTVTFAAGATTADVVVRPLDDTAYEPAETVIVTAVAGTGYSLGSAATGTVSITSNDPPPLAVVTVSTPDAAAAEAGLDPGTIRFTRSGGVLSSPLTVTYAIAGTATSATDYQALSGVVTFAAGATTANVVVRPLDDAAYESVETVILTATTGAGYSLGSAKTGQVSITSDDPPPLPVVSIASASIKEGNAGFQKLSFTLTLSAASTQAMSVRWATSNGTATAGSDYEAASGTVSFAPGQRTATVTVKVTGDRIIEADETFFVTLSAPVRATVSSTAGRATGTIRNDDSILRIAAFAALGSLCTSTTKKT